MRIRDWSSDVCSSDLLPGLGTGGTATLTVTNGTFAAGDVTVSADGFGALGGFADDFSSDHGDRGGNGSGDRQSVVAGRSGSVRVGLCGRRMIHKKNSTPSHDNQYKIILLVRKK